MDSSRRQAKAAAAAAPAPAPDLALLSSHTNRSSNSWNQYGSPPTISVSNGSDAGTTAAGASTSKSRSAKSPGIFQLPSSQQHPRQPSAPLSSHSDEWSRGSAGSASSSVGGTGGLGTQIRYMTLVFQDKETVLMMPQTYKASKDSKEGCSWPR